MKKFVTLLATVSAVAFLAACSEQEDKPMTMPDNQQTRLVRPLRQAQSPKHCQSRGARLYFAVYGWKNSQTF